MPDAAPCDTGAIRRRAATAWPLALAVAVVAPGSPAQAAAATWEARVVRVSDGDTLWVRSLAGGRATKLRIDGIDAPELCQRGGRESRLALQNLVLQRTVRVDVAARDNYGRGIARIELGGQDVGERLVRDGHAWNDRFRFHVGPYAEQEAQARAARRGVFADPAAVEPREFRRVHGPCAPPPSTSRPPRAVPAPAR